MPVDPPSSSVVHITIERQQLVRLIPVAVYYPLQYAGAPVGSVGSIGIWNPPSMDHPVQRVPVPVPGASAFLNRPHVAVRFRNLRGGSPSMGVHLADLYPPVSGPSTIQGAQAIVLNGFGGPSKELKFMIDWPGYEPERSMISTVSSNGGPLTRSELGKNIMAAYGRFFRKVVTEKKLPSQAGYFNIALHQGQGSSPDSMGIQLWQLHLVSFREPAPADDHWVAEIDIVPA